jgi:NitT/TauT family transport system substrate-binding protein
MRKNLFSLMLVLTLAAAALLPLGQPGAQAQTKLKMGLLPILDVLPFYVADQAGYFTEEGLEIELVPVSSALERDQLLLAGEIDGMLNDLISTGIFNQDEARIQIVAMARRAFEDAPQFRILAAPRSNITIPNDLKNVEIGISENSVIHYIAQRIMEDNGVSADELSWITEPNIPVRFQLLMEGTMLAVCLPDPLAQAAIEGGAILIADDSSLVESEFSQSVLTFRTDIIEDNPEAVEAFLRAWMRAAEDVNADPEAYRDLWIENTNVPESVRDSYVLPPFPTYAITQPLAWDDTMVWLVEQGIIDEAPSYESSVNPAFLEAIAPAEEGTAGDPANGEALFANLGCIGCHSLDGSQATGPTMQGIGATVAAAHEGVDPAAYLRESIVEPNAVVAEGFPAIMPAYTDLSESELNDLVAYLLTLE